MADNVPLPNGTIVQDTYEIVSFLGAGGMGSTYKARHIAMGHDVCVKVINSNLLQDTRVLDLFKREATLMRDLAQSGSSDAIVKIETLLRDASGAHYLIMEFIDGKPLSHYIQQGARLAEKDVLLLGRRLLEALKEIHAKNIIHRDVSPDNIMVPDDTILKAKILDFGVATDVVGTEKSILGDSFAGKIGYASPEQLGLFDGKISAKSDIYSLGLVLLAVAGITPPGKGSMAAAVEARKVDIKVETKKLSAETCRLLEGMLKANPAERSDTLDAGAQPPGPPTPPPAEPKSKMPLVAGLGALVVVGGAAAFFGLRPAETTDIAANDVTPAVTTQSPDQPSETAQTQPDQMAETPEPEEIALVDPEVTAPEPPEPEAEVEFDPPEEEPVVQSPVPAPEPKPQPEPEASPEPTEPLELARYLLIQGGKTNARRAFDVLLAHMSDDAAPRLDRAEAAALIGWMYDPKYYTSTTSPFSGPSVEDALKAYRFARKLGLTSVQRDISRLVN